ncbi:MAG: SulP family inorganic anion transporter [Burkholderiales bacterium]
MIARLVSFAAMHTPFRFREASAGDWRAGWVSAVVMLPQTVVLATLAGMPPETGVYTSVFPVIVAALLGASPRLLSGPNTALAVMLAAALTPLATPNSAEYVALALSLTAMVGLMQLLAAAARLGRLFDAMPDSIVHGVTLGVGCVILITQLPAIFGILTVPGEAPWVSLWHAIAGLPRLNAFALAVAAVSILAALASRRLRMVQGTLLVVALGSGTVLALLLDGLVGSATTNLDRVGHMALRLLPVSLPRFSWDQFYVLKELLQSALAIAMIGALQTVIIARSICSPHGEKSDPNRELLAQGLGNTVASLTSGFAGSGSFNRSAAHVNAGARSPWAAVLSAVILFGVVFAAGGLLALVPAAAMAGALVLVGWGLIRSTPFRTIRSDGKYSLPATLAVAILVVASGLEAAVFWACAVGLAVTVWQRAREHRPQNAGDDPPPPGSPTASAPRPRATRRSGRKSRPA